MSLPDDHLIGAEIPDVEHRPELLDLLMRQAVERRIGGVEALHGLTSAWIASPPPLINREVGIS